METTVHGTVAPGLEPVRDAFAENFRSRGEVGAGLCIERDGQRIVDLWAGTRRGDEPWESDTCSVLFSGTKGLVACCLLLLVQRGELELDRPVQRYWPSLSVPVTVRQLLNHRSGLVGLDTSPMPHLDDPESMAALLERQQPMWIPGRAQGYGAVTAGLYNAELLRRVTTQTVGPFFRDEVAGPLGLDLHIGLPEELTPAELLPVTRLEFARVMLTLVAGSGMDHRLFRASAKKGTPTQRATAQPTELGPNGLQNFNRRELLEKELPWCGGVGSARGMAGLYSRLACASGPWTARTLRPLWARQSWATPDQVLRKNLGWSQAFLKEEPHLYSPHRESFGHPGAGGSFGFADPVLGLGMGFVTRRMDWRMRSHRARSICHALYDCLL